MTAEDRTGSLLPVLAYEPDRKLFFCAIKPWPSASFASP